MDFTIDDMIKFCKSKLEYHKKEADLCHERLEKKPKNRDAYLLERHNSSKIAYSNMFEGLLKLKENQNERRRTDMKKSENYEEETLDKIVSIVQTAEEEIEFCDKIDAAVVQRVTYDRIVKLLKENNYV